MKILLLPLNQAERHLRFKQFNFHRNSLSLTLCYIKKEKKNNEVGSKSQLPIAFLRVVH